MKTKFAHCILMLIFIFSVKAQNFVPNPSFEIHDTCPWGQSQISYAVGWNTFRNTPDYFNSCDTNGQAGVPLNVLGFQNAKTGNSYGGFYAYSHYGQYREIIGVQLIHPLIIKEKYFVSFYINTAFNPNPGWHSTIATNKIGARFSTNAYSYSNPISIDNYAQIYTDSIIFDTVNWIKISGSFIADSAYNFVSFGNFFSNSFTNYISQDSLSAYAYYYIDDILVTADSLIVGLNNQSYSERIIKLIPNPARDWIVIEGSDLISFSIFDLSGRKFIEDTFVPTSLKSIYVGNLSKGIYLIQVKDLNQSFNKKLIIQ